MRGHNPSTQARGGRSCQARKASSRRPIRISALLGPCSPARAAQGRPNCPNVKHHPARHQRTSPLRCALSWWRPVPAAHPRFAPTRDPLLAPVTAKSKPAGGITHSFSSPSPPLLGFVITFSCDALSCGALGLCFARILRHGVRRGNVRGVFSFSHTPRIVLPAFFDFVFYFFGCLIIHRLSFGK